MAVIKKTGKAEIFASRLRSLRGVMKEARVDSLLVSDMINIRYLTGFTGSSAKVVVSVRGATFFTDFRYTTQAAQEVHGFRVIISASPSFLADLSSTGQ